jgi:hypothetical protein
MRRLRDTGLLAWTATAIAGLLATAAAAGGSPPLAAVNGYWADIAAGKYAAAYEYVAPSNRTLTSPQFVASERSYGIQHVQFRGAVAASTGTSATVAVVLLKTVDRQYGCRMWTGAFVMVKQASRWLIARSEITPRACAASPSRPVLAGPWGRDQQGYGQVAPTTIFNGGDPTGLVTHIHWFSWGDPTATGTGMAEWVGPNQIVAQGTAAPATVVVFHLGTCHGRSAYDAIEWYFPEHGQRFSASTYIDPCTGVYASPPPPAPTKPSTLGVHDFNGNKLNVAASVYADPATPADQFSKPSSGARLIAIHEVVTDEGPGGIDSDANSDTTLVGSNGQAYTPVFDGVQGCTNFAYGEFTLSRGESESGCVVFAVPNGVSIKRVTFSLTDGAVDTVGWTG